MNKEYHDIIILTQLLGNHILCNTFYHAVAFSLPNREESPQAMEAEEEKEEAEFQEEMARIKARQVAVHAEKKASMKRLGLVEVMLSKWTDLFLEDNCLGQISHDMLQAVNLFRQMVFSQWKVLPLIWLPADVFSNFCSL